MAEWTIENLSSKHLRDDFSSGKLPLDKFLRELAGQYERRRLGRTFVVTKPGELRVFGYYTLAAGSCETQHVSAALRKQMPKHAIPTIHLGRLAIDQTFHGQGLGQLLLLHALKSALDISTRVGAFAVDVRALDEEAEGFYQAYGFLPMEDHPQHYFLSMKTIASMFDPP